MRCSSPCRLRNSAVNQHLLNLLTIPTVSGILLPRLVIVVIALSSCPFFIAAIHLIFKGIVHLKMYFIYSPLMLIQTCMALFLFRKTKNEKCFNCFCLFKSVWSKTAISSPIGFIVYFKISSFVIHPKKVMIENEH